MIIILELNKIVNEDCIEYMKTLPNNCIDLIIADPPYNKKVSSWDKFTTEEYLNFIKNFILECKRILSYKGNIFIYNQQPMASYMFEILYENLNFIDEIIWYYKNGGGNSKNKCKNSHQLLYWFSITDKYIKNLECIRQPYSGTRERYKHNVDKNPNKIWTPNDKGAMPTNVWEVSIVRQTESTKLAKIGVQKPIEISDRIIKLGSNDDSLVYIPFAGSGSEIISCIKNNRNYIATEINKEYINDIIIPRIINKNTI